LTLSEIASNANGRQHLRIGLDSWHLRQNRAELLYQLHGRKSRGTWLQAYENAPCITSRGGGHERIHPRLLGHDLVQSLLVRHHAVERNALHALGEDEDLPRILVGKKAHWHHVK